MKKVDLNLVLLIGYIGGLVCLVTYNMIVYGFSNCSF